ncbi:DNA-binding transcriptional regulator HexR [compost metagenome]
MPGSPLARACDISLNVDVPEDPDVYAPMTSRLAHLAVLDVLAVSVALARGPELVAQLRRSNAVLQEKRTPES